jgi:hypothetical protein
MNLILISSISDGVPVPCFIRFHQGSRFQSKLGEDPDEGKADPATRMGHLNLKTSVIVPKESRKARGR